MHLVESISVAMELWYKVLSIQSTKRLLKGEHSKDSSHRFERGFERENISRQRPVSSQRILGENEPVSNQLEKSPECYNWQGAMTILYWW
jgi:hypothetical protein